MKFSLSLVGAAALALSALPAQAQDANTPTIQTPPAIVQCQPVQVGFAGGQAPYFVSILPGGDISAPAIQTFPVQNAAGAYTWNANIAAGTSITFQIRDSRGVLNYSQQVTIQSSGDSSCLGQGQPTGPVAGSASSRSSSSSSVNSASSAASSISSSVASVRSSLSSEVSSRASSASSALSSAVSSISSGASSALSAATFGASSAASAASSAATPSAAPTGAASSTAHVVGKVALVAGVMAVSAMLFVGA